METKTAFGAPQAWDEEADIVVVGSGFAGLAAAIEASSSAKRVLVLEKMPYYGGNSIISGGGYSSWDSKLDLRRKLNLGDDSWELHLSDTLKGGGYLNLPELAELLVKKAPEGLNWLCDLGVEFEQALTRIGGHSAHRSYHSKGSLGKSLTEPLKNCAVSRGAEIRMNSKVTAIWRKDSGSPVLGVRTGYGKDEINIRAKCAVVLASGGFARDVDLRMAHNPSLVPEYNCTNHKGATGEIIKYAQAIGADTLHMSYVQLYPCADPKFGKIDKFALYCYSGTGYGLIYVDKTGRRFVNELDTRDVVSNAQINLNSKPTYSILNKEIFSMLSASEDSIDRAAEKGRIIAADTIENLAEIAGMPKDILSETVTKHNGYIADGCDADFHKPMGKNMVKLEKGPFYAIPQWPSIHYCMGGLRIDTEARVVDIWGEPIPGLFAAGEVCGGIHGANRLGGNAIADCIVFGRIAGQNAAATSLA